MKIKIRKFREEDLRDVFALNRALFAMHGVKATITMRQFANACLSDKLTKCFVATIDGKIVGFSNSHDWIHLGLGTRICMIDQLYTHEKYRRQGIGLTLMRHMVKDAVKRGCSKIEVLAAKDNKLSNSFYKKTVFSLKRSASNKYALQKNEIVKLIDIIDKKRSA